MVALSGILIGVLIAAFMLFSACKPVAAGEVGVKLSRGAVTGEMLHPGWHFIVPAFEGVDNMSVQTHVFVVKAESASKDLQSVSADIAVNYHLEAEKATWVRENLGPSFSYRDRVLMPAIQETVKATTAMYPAEELIGQRESVQADLLSRLTTRVERFGIKVLAVSVTNFDFSADFNTAVEAKVTAEQKALQAENDLKRVRTEAQQQIERAKAEAESIRIRSEALAQNQNLVEWEAIQKWDGKLPQITSGAIPFVNVAAQTGR